MMHYGRLTPDRLPANANTSRCARSVVAALQRAFGAHHDLPEIANFVVQLCYGRSVRQCRVLLRASLQTGQLASEVSPSYRQIFRRAAMQGLRKGRCFKHQVARRGYGGMRFGEEPAAFDPNILVSVLTASLGFAGNVVNAATEAENRAALEAAAETSGANTAGMQGLLDDYAALMTANQSAAVTATNSGNAAEIARVRDENAALLAEIERKMAESESSEGPSQLAVAGMVVGGLAALGGTAWLISRIGGNANMHYGGMHYGGMHDSYGEANMHDSYGDHCYGGHCN